MVGLWALLNIQIRSDLTAFLPDAKTDAEILLLDELQNGVSSRLIPVAVIADDLDALVSMSKSMATQLGKSELFNQIHNGQQSIDSAQLEWVIRHRYLLSPNIDAERFTQGSLREALDERMWELGSAAEFAVKDLLARDPTHESLAVFKQWQPTVEPETHRGVWVQSDPQRALLMVETAAPGFDLDAQALAIAAIQNAYLNALAENDIQSGDSQLMMTGPGPFGVELRSTTQAESQWFSTIAVTLLIIFLFAVYRSVRWVIIGALPLASGVLLAIVAINSGYGGLHGITLAFGVTLLGVAIDYPLHLFSHQTTGESANDTMRRIWPTLRLGVASTCIAYLTMVLSDFEGLAQLGWLTVIGLLIAAATTRWLLPGLMTNKGQDRNFDAATGWARQWRAWFSRCPRIHWLLMLTMVIGLLLWLSSRPQLWQDDLGSLTPVSEESQRLDQQLRQALAAPDLRFMAVLKADSPESALRASERLGNELDEVVETGWITGYDSPSRYLPSTSTQLQRQAHLPDPETLTMRLRAAQSGMPFKADLFRPFLLEVDQARVQQPLVLGDILQTPLGALVTTLLKQSPDGQWRAMIPLHSVNDAVELEAWFAERPWVKFIDLKASSENMVAGFRNEMLWRMAAATMVILLILMVGLRPGRRWVFVLLPVLATVLATASLLNLMSIRLSLFHMTSLMLVGGIVLDYALFFDREESEPDESIRTFHALSVCCVSTLTVFGILGLSQIPVLRAIGSTVACGVFLGYFLAILGRRQN